SRPARTQRSLRGPSRKRHDGVRLPHAARRRAAQQRPGPHAGRGARRVMVDPPRTEVLAINPERPEAAVLARPAAALPAGGLVAFPTETVYGLGANALDAAAVDRIFAAKGRPPNNPLIVHVTSSAAAQRLVTQWPEAAARLAARFWPGPLTLVLPRSAVVP